MSEGYEVPLSYRGDRYSCLLPRRYIILSKVLPVLFQVYYFTSTRIKYVLVWIRIIIIIIINDTLARSLEPVVTECKEHTIHTQTQIVASRKPKEIKHTHEGEANFTT